MIENFSEFDNKLLGKLKYSEKLYEKILQRLIIKTVEICLPFLETEWISNEDSNIRQFIENSYCYMNIEKKYLDLLWSFENKNLLNSISYFLIRLKYFLLNFQKILCKDFNSINELLENYTENENFYEGIFSLINYLTKLFNLSKISLNDYSSLIVNQFKIIKQILNTLSNFKNSSNSITIQKNEKIFSSYEFQKYLTCLKDENEKKK